MPYNPNSMNKTKIQYDYLRSDLEGESACESEDILATIQTALKHTDAFLDQLRNSMTHGSSNANSNSSSIYNTKNSCKNDESSQNVNLCLGAAVQRFCIDLADGIHDIAMQIKDDREEGYYPEHLARRHVEDARKLSFVIMSKTPQDNDDQKHESIVEQISDEEVMSAMISAETVLLDVEDALRSISLEEAQDVAELSLVVAQMFIGTLRTAISVLADNNHDSFGENENVVIEELYLDDEGNDTTVSNSNEYHKQSAQHEKKPIHDDSIPRMRALWPPLSSFVANAGEASLSSALGRPILASVLVMILWPTIICAALFVSPLLIIDSALQHGYNWCLDQENPILVNIERGAAGAYKVGQLYFVCGKILVKQGIRVGKRQIERRGGFQNVLNDIGRQTVHSITHPSETGQYLVESAQVTWTTVCDFVSSVQRMRDAASTSTL